MKVIYLGTPQFAVQPLKNILQSSHEIVAVVTQPDKAKARGKKVLPCEVKQYAQSKGLKVLQYGRIRDNAAIEELRALNADIMVTCAYGQILSEELLSLTKHGVINIHASLLPKYRGSSPVQWALIKGEKVIGITIMQTAYSVDSGDIILQESLALNGTENTAEALEMLSPIGGELIVKALDLIENNQATFTKQNEIEVTNYPMLKKEDGKLDFNKTALEVINFIRGMNPWPGAYTFTKYGMLKVKKAEKANLSCKNASMGDVVESDPKTGLIIKCSDACINLTRVQSENSKEMDISDFLRGKPVEKGTKL